jgi:hypothetical protein
VSWLCGAGYSVTWQDDFTAGTSFVAQIHDRLARGAIVIALLSKEYLLAGWTKAEWEAAFDRQIRTRQLSLIPVIVRPCEPEGLLAPLVRIDLTPFDEEGARAHLVDRVAAALGEDRRRTANPRALSPVPPPRATRWRQHRIQIGFWTVALLLSFGWTWVTEKRAPEPPEPTLNAVVRTLFPLESRARGDLAPATDNVPAGAYASLVLPPVDTLLPGDYCYELKAARGRYSRRNCGLQVGVRGDLTLGLPPHSLRAGLYELMIYRQGMRPGTKLASYRFQVEDEK